MGVEREGRGREVRLKENRKRRESKRLIKGQEAGTRLVEADIRSCLQKPVLPFSHSSGLSAGHMTALLKNAFSRLLCSQCDQYYVLANGMRMEVMFTIDCLEGNPRPPFPPLLPFQWAFVDML